MQSPTARAVRFSRWRRGALMAVLAAGLTVPAAAQEVATTFEGLRLKVKAGDMVYVTGADGRERQAQILELSATSLVVSMDEERAALTESGVTRIRQRLPDGLKNGALIGFLVGGGSSTAGSQALASPSGSCRGGCVAANLAFGGGLGALVGVGIDAMKKGKRTIYVPGRTAASVTVQPLLSSDHLGVRFGWRF